MQRFWDERADENALFFVDNRLDYRAPNQGRFWEHGRRDLEALLEAAAARVRPGDVVVEVGCGVGRLTRPLAARAKLVRALDVSPHAEPRPAAPSRSRERGLAAGRR
jgi:2-polyprenyl-3-methyl-5-hydroxy-6-metoxy-1,4-benzoquinol methylase